VSTDGTFIPEPVEQAGRRWALRGRDRQLVGALGPCRYLTIRQVIEPGVGAKTEKASGYKVRGLAGEETRSEVRVSRRGLLRCLPFRSFAGVHLWALTPSGRPLACVRRACWGHPPLPFGDAQPDCPPLGRRASRLRPARLTWCPI
jgi:hypothetical protein